MSVQELLDRLENHYTFECEGGPLRNCVEWFELKRRLADFPASFSPVREAEPTPADMGRGWRVEVSRSGEDVIAIEGEMLAGKPEITEEDRQLIVGCARHLLAFAGDGRSTFLPDDEPPLPCGRPNR